MTKAFDLAELAAAAKVAGLPVLDQDLKMVVGVVLKWVGDSLALEAQSSPVFAIGLPLIAALQPEIDKAIDAALAPQPAPAA